MKRLKKMVREGGGTWQLRWLGRKVGLTSGASSDSFCTTKYGSPNKNTRQKSYWKIETVLRKKGNEWNGTPKTRKRMIEERQ